MKRPLRVLLAATAATLLALFVPLSAHAATAVEDPFVSVSTRGEVGSAYIEWFTTGEVQSIEVTARDANGAVTTRDAPASQGWMAFTGLPSGTWSADVTAIAGNSRSSAVPVSIAVEGPKVVEQPTAPPVVLAPTPTAPTAAPTPETIAAAQVSFVVVPGPDGGLAGAQITVSATGLQIVSPYGLTIAGTSVPLFSGTATEAGTAELTVPLPDGLAAGEHILEFTGVAADGEATTASYTLTVAAAPEAPAPATPVETAPQTSALEDVLNLRGEEAVPYLVSGAVAATAATGAAAGAASAVSLRIRKLRLLRLLDLEYPGTGSGGRGGLLGTVMDMVAKLRGVG